MRKKSHRMERVNAHLRRILSELIFKEYEAKIADLLTITAVNTLADLSEAKIYLTAAQNIERHVRELNKRSPRFRALIKPALDFKKIPQLKFEADQHLEAIMRIENYLSHQDPPND